MGRGLILALTCPGGGGSGSQNCPEGREALTPCVSWGWTGLKKNVAHPSLRIISGTALKLCPPPPDLVTKLVTRVAGVDVNITKGGLWPIIEACSTKWGGALECPQKIFRKLFKIIP